MHEPSTISQVLAKKDKAHMHFICAPVGKPPRSIVLVGIHSQCTLQLKKMLLQMFG
uniref:Uncharacterized protein n=1 Tax=Arundo donax TaxID=35708 RepID=A0A0A9ECU8_ARUDO